ncbi:MAG: hypothetical protein M3342_16355 [Bacteroidota bacterium]|nr:hypothetical protein [Bacteroidota bacterium]
MLTISIPEDIDQQLSLLTNNKEEFILTAIRQKIAMSKKSYSPEEMAKEYADSVEENKSIMNDFKFADQEGWDEY